MMVTALISDRNGTYDQTDLGDYARSNGTILSRVDAVGSVAVVRFALCNAYLGSIRSKANSLETT